MVTAQQILVVMINNKNHVAQQILVVMINNKYHVSPTILKPMILISCVFIFIQFKILPSFLFFGTRII